MQKSIDTYRVILKYFQFEKETKYYFTNMFSQFMIICGFIRS